MAITALLGDVANIVKGKGPGRVINIDNKAFQLHYRFTTFLFFVFSIVSTANSLVGDPINCACADCDRAGITKKMIDTHCWIGGTYTLSQVPTHQIGLNKAFHGLGWQRGTDNRKYHMYYQWVPFVLFIQGVLFYMPHWMWEINEDGRVQALVHDLRGPTMDKDTLKKKIHNLTMYVMETMGSYDGYYLRFIVCDAMNTVNAVVNLFLTNRFLNYEFLSYGPRCMQYFNDHQQSAINPMTVTFPKLTKCQMQTFGVSGTVQNLDALCVMALNIFNEKIYLVLWFWLLALVTISVVVFITRTVFMQIKRLRVPLFQRRAHTMNIHDIEDVVKGFTVGDFFFLSLLGKNMDITAFRMFLAQLARSVRRRREFKDLAFSAVRASKRNGKNKSAYQRAPTAPPPAHRHNVLPVLP